MALFGGRWKMGPAGPETRSRGAVLIEVLIALAILGLVATVFAGAMFTSLQSARLSDERSTALTLAKSQIEFVRAVGYSVDDWDYTVDTSSRSYTHMPSWWTTPPPLLPAEFAGYSVTVAGISDIDLDNSGGPDEGIRTITAVVSHNGTIVFTLENYEVDR